MLANDEIGRKSLVSYLAAVFLCAAVVLGLSWTYTATQGIRFLESGYSVWNAKRSMLSACDLGDVAVFGDSRADSAVIPARFSKPATNLGFAGGTPIEIYFFAKSLQSCATKPKMLLLSFNPNAFEIVQPWLWDNAVRYGAIGWNEISTIRQEAERLGTREYFAAKPQIGIDGLLRDLTYSARFPSIYFNSLVESRLLFREETNRRKFTEVMHARGYPSYGSKAQLVGVKAGSDTVFTPLALQQSFFEKTVAMLDRAGIDTYFLIAPFSQAGRNAHNPRYQAAYLDFVRRVGAQYPHFHLLQQQVPVWPNVLFVDGYHLNESGADAFSRQLNRCVEEIGAAAGTHAECKFDLPNPTVNTAQAKAGDKLAL